MRRSMIIVATALFIFGGGGCQSGPEQSPSGEQSAEAPSGKRAEPTTAPDKPRAPDQFAVKLVTTKGEIIIDVNRAWAPRGADRFHELVTAGYYDGVAFFRVVEGFMAQTGISGDPSQNKAWRRKRIKDDQVTQSNTRGMLSFATSGPHSRTTQFFISFGDNSRLDGMGFAPFAKVRDMAVVDQLYNGYGEGAPKGNGPSQGRLQREGNPYLEREFPKLDYIKKATVI